MNATSEAEESMVPYLKKLLKNLKELFTLSLRIKNEFFCRQFLQVNASLCALVDHLKGQMNITFETPKNCLHSDKGPAITLAAKNDKSSLHRCGNYIFENSTLIGNLEGFNRKYGVQFGQETICIYFKSYKAAKKAVLPLIDLLGESQISNLSLSIRRSSRYAIRTAAIRVDRLEAAFGDLKERPTFRKLKSSITANNSSIFKTKEDILRIKHTFQADPHGRISCFLYIYVTKEACRRAVTHLKQGNLIIGGPQFLSVFAARIRWLDQPEEQ